MGIIKTEKQTNKKTQKVTDANESKLIVITRVEEHSYIDKWNASSSKNKNIPTVKATWITPN